MEGKRLEYIDATKGIAMLFVVWGHVYHGTLSEFFYVFHMPLFFVISGFLYNSEKYNSLCMLAKNRFKRLIVPYIIYSCATWALWAGYRYVLSHDTTYILYSLMQTFEAQGSGGYLMHNAPLWFITCLFMVEMIYYLLNKIFKVKSGLLVALMISLATMYSVRYNLVPHLRELPWNLEVAMAALFFYAFGQFIRHESLVENMLQMVVSVEKYTCAMYAAVCALSMVVCVLLYRITGGADMGGDYFTECPVLFIPAAITGTVMTSCIGIVMTKTESLKRICGWINWIGRNTLDILMIHVPVKGVIIVILARYWNVTLQGDSYFYEMDYALVAFVVTLLIVVPFIMVLNRVKECF